MDIVVRLGQDEDGEWCASAEIDRSGVGAVGDGSTPGRALRDLGEALDLVIEETKASA